MDRETAKSRLCGCYVTLPTLFLDGDLGVDLLGIRRHVRFLIDAGITTGTGVLLAGGGAGEFSTLTLDERIEVAGAVVEEADGSVPVVMGAQTTSTRELVELARAAERIGAEFIQVSPPYYFAHTEADFHEYVVAAAEAANVGIVIYNTFWTSSAISMQLIERLLSLPNVMGLKWSTPDTGFMEFEQVVYRFADELSIIDNQLRFPTSHMLGARGVEVHICNYWPEWGIRLWNLLETQDYLEAQRELVRVAMPFMALWKEIEQHTGGDGYLDKLCMELVGLGSSRCRPPTRDVSAKYRDRARRMLLETGAPRIAERLGDSDMEYAVETQSSGTMLE